MLVLEGRDLQWTQAYHSGCPVGFTNQQGTGLGGEVLRLGETG